MGTMEDTVDDTATGTYRVSHTVVDTGLGPLTVVLRGAALAGLYFPGHWHLPPPSVFGPRLHGTTGAEARLAGRVADQLAEYLAGTRTGFEVPLQLSGSPRQLEVWSAVARIPYGATTTYGELARQVGDSHPRLIGAAVGRNPASIVVPCHRVVGAGGRLTGYAGGLDRKRHLLDLEAAVSGRAARLF